jgi:hypothetical protein
VILGIAATASVIIILAGSLWIRSRRKRASFGALTPGTALAQPDAKIAQVSSS